MVNPLKTYMLPGHPTCQDAEYRSDFAAYSPSATGLSRGAYDQLEYLTGYPRSPYLCNLSL